MNFLVEPKKGTKWPSNLPRFKTRQEAIAVCKELCRLHFIHRSEKRGKGDLVVSPFVFFCWYLCRVVMEQCGRTVLRFSVHHWHFSLISFQSNPAQTTKHQQISRNREFDESGYFTWIYEGDKSFSNMMTTLLVVGFLFCTCFPIWPNFLKVFVWYMSVTLLIFIFFLITVRGAIFLCIWILGYECWVLPNLFDETLGFVESFKPFISFEPTKEGQLIYRAGIAVAFVSFCYWAVTQPSEFDGFKQGQVDFIKDLYAGTLLSDMSQADKDNIDKPKMPSLDDLLKKLDSSDDEEEELDEEEKVAKMLEDLVGDEDEDIDEDGEE